MPCQAAGGVVLVEAVPYLLLAILLFLFWWPGYAWASWLHQRERFHWTFRVVLGFAWSLAIFAVVGWPFLWRQATPGAFLTALAIVWSGFSLLALGIAVRRGGAKDDTLQEPFAHSSGGVNPLATNDRPGLSALVFWLGYLCLAGVLASTPYWLRDVGMALGDVGWTCLAGVAGLLLAMGGLVARRHALGGRLAFHRSDDLPAPRWVIVLVLAFLLLAAASAMVLDRPDWDDCYYLAAVLDYAEGERLNDQEPTHREGFPVSPINRLLAWELFNSVLVRLSGIDPMTIHRVVMPGLLVLLAYAAYARLLSEFVPRRWVPLALLGLAACHAWGISSHSSAANFLLPRTAQGKTVLMHLAFPTMLVLARRFMLGPCLKAWLGLLAGVVFGLAASSSAIFLALMVLTCAGAALWIVAPRSRNWRAPLGMALACLPPIGLGLLIRQAVMRDPALIFDGGGQWWWPTWQAELEYYAGWGASELLWVLLTPATWLLLAERGRRWYLIVFPLTLLATFANPVLVNLVATHLTSRATYFRVFWLFPVAVGLGTVAALMGRLAARVLERRTKLAPDAIATGVVVVFLAASWILPGFYVWGPTNVGILSRPRLHPLATNLRKMPADLQRIADELRAEPHVSEHRILADESVTSYLTPYDRRFRFVQTRHLYTLYGADLAGRREEGQRRYLLSLLLTGELPHQPGDPPTQFAHPFYSIPRFPNPPATLTADVLIPWLDELNVVVAITESRVPEKVRRALAAVGFVPASERGEFMVWRRGAAK